MSKNAFQSDQERYSVYVGTKVTQKNETNKKTYANLTYEKMEEYIRTQANSEEMLKEFKKAKEVAKAKNQAYAATKKWFFENYPEYKENGVCDKELGKTNVVANEDIKEITTIIPFKKAINE